MGCWVYNFLPKPLAMDTTPFGGNGKSFVGSDLIGMCSEQTPSQDHDVHQVTAIPYCSDSKADGN